MSLPDPMSITSTAPEFGLLDSRGSGLVPGDRFLSVNEATGRKQWSSPIEYFSVPQVAVRPDNRLAMPKDGDRIAHAGILRWAIPADTMFIVYRPVVFDDFALELERLLGGAV